MQKSTRHRFHIDYRVYLSACDEVKILGHTVTGEKLTLILSMESGDEMIFA